MGTVIKFGDAVGVLERVTTVTLADHMAEARAALERARAEAKQILDAARTEAMRLRQDAERKGFESGSARGYETGLASGETAGREQGRQSAREEALQRYNEQCAHLVADFQRLVAEFSARKEELLQSTERSLLDFAVRLASKLTFAIGTLHRDAAVANVERAVQLVGATTDLTIHVHPDDLASIESFAKDSLERIADSRALKITADDSIAPGGCKLQTDAAEIDATLETQVNEIVNLLLGTSTTHG